MLLTSWPASRYVPVVATSRQPRMCISVDLPDPDGPMIATYSPCSIESYTPRNASTSIAPVLYTLRTASSSMTGAVAIGVIGSVTAAGLATDATDAPATRELSAGRELTPARELSAARERAAGASGAGPASTATDPDLRDDDLVARHHAGRDLRLAARGEADLHRGLDCLAVLDLLYVLAAGGVAVQRGRGDDEHVAELLVGQRGGHVRAVVQPGRCPGHVDDDRV